MAKFKIDWKKGKDEIVEQSDCDTVEQFINTRFGRGVKPAAKITLVEDKPAEAKPATKSKVAK